MQNRDKGIIRSSFVGIIGNVVLVVFKLIVGILANSIAIILDAVNNASDVLSSVITIIGTKLAGRRADRDHPFGYGRVEYLTSMVIALIILAAGVVSARESIEKIIHPAVTDYTMFTVIVVIAGILVKIFIGFYLCRAGKKYSSQALRASGIDSNYDAVISGGTLVAALAAMLWNINIDGIVGLLISVFVLKAGIDILRDAINPIIGERESDDLGRKIKEYVCAFEDVKGAYDLMLDNFGPNEIIGSIHIEVTDDMPASQIAELTRDISQGVYEKFKIILTVGIYAVDATPAHIRMRDELDRIAKEHPEILEVHGFYVNDARSVMAFDLVMDFKVDAESIKNAVVNKMRASYPDYDYSVVIDTDYVD